MRHAASTQRRSAGARRAPGRRRSGQAGGVRPMADRPDAAGQADPAAQGLLARVGPLAYWIVLAGTIAALAVMRQGVHLLRSGTFVLAGTMLVAAAARMVVPEGRAGMLSSRRRLLDVAIFSALGLGLLVAGIVVPGPG
ncbi:MAG TPA: DUF3017 domain-containing protein [Streptosporangiaceae bacterium]|nr:DUF3017 domain-containing protein [Streptosporangiaceae bacterium]